MSDKPSEIIADGIVDEIAQRGLSIDDETWEFAVAEIARAIASARREENEACAKTTEATPVYLGEVLRARRDIADAIRSRFSPPAITSEKEDRP